MEPLKQSDTSVTTYTFHHEHWFEGKAIQFRCSGRRPRTLREWARMVWNADVFYGSVPLLKTAIGVLYVLDLIRWLS